MIVSMQRVRVMGPLERLAEVLAALQDAGTLHPSPGAPVAGLRPVELDRRQSRRVRQLRSILDDVEACLEKLEADRTAGRSNSAEVKGAGREAVPGDDDRALVRWARLARRLRRRLEAVEARRRDLAAEAERLEVFRRLAEVLPDDLRERLAETLAEGRLRGDLLLLKGGERTLGGLEDALRRDLGDDFELVPLPVDDRLAVLLLTPRGAAERLEALVNSAGTEELVLPADYSDTPLFEALPAIERRGRELAELRRELDDEVRDLARRHGDDLERARARVRDRLALLDVLALARRTERAFVLAGWVPAPEVEPLRRHLHERCGDDVAVSRVDGDHVPAGGPAPLADTGDDAPVELSNPPIFRPFEALVRPFSLPRYGSLDPTPFVAVFLPMFFGLILGDVGYGLALAVLGLVAIRLAERESIWRSVGQIALACALFAILFGLLFGELFGDLGQRMGWLHPILFDREEAVVPFLALAVSLGFVHLFLGLVLGVFGAWKGERRHALGRGLTALMLVLVAVALLAIFRVIPRELLTPAAVLLLASFPVLVVLEGLAAPIEMLSTLGRVLSYARIMAIGTASVMLAVVANRLVGAFGSVIVGVLFALLFHLVNFALGLFSPTIHALRLHYVEFFGTFYDPGGARYRPFAHWRARPAGPPHPPERPGGTTS